MNRPDTGWPTALRALLAATGWTQPRLAEAIGASTSAVEHWLAGRRTPTALYARETRRVLREHGIPQP